MFYLSWFPGLSSWFKALILFICITPLVFVLQFSAVSLFLVLDVIEHWDVISRQDFAVIEGMSLFVWFSIVGLILPVFVFSRVHQFFWGDPDPKLPSWMPSRESQIAGFGDWLTALFCLLICSIIEAVKYERYTKISNEEARNIAILFIMLAAFIYQIRRKLTPKSK